MVERLELGESLHPYDICYYFASSIADMQTSRDEIVDTILSEDRAWYLGLTRGDRYFHLIEQQFLGPFRLIHRKTLFGYPRAIVFVPPVRHYPENDPKKRGMISLNDLSGSCEVELPSGDQRNRVVNESLRNDPQAYAKNSWAGAVVILNAYNVHGRDRSVLLHVDKSVGFEKDTSQVLRGMFELFRPSPAGI